MITFKNQLMKQQATQRMHSKGIPFRDWWECGCHRQTAFCHYERGELLVTDKLAHTTLGIPFHQQLTDEDIQIILRSVAPHTSDN